MKQYDMIKLLQDTGSELGQPVAVKQTKHGFRLSAAGRSLNLGPDGRREIAAHPAR